MLKTVRMRRTSLKRCDEHLFVRRARAPRRPPCSCRARPRCARRSRRCRRSRASSCSGRKPLISPLEHAQRWPLGLDDLSVGDDLLLDVRDVAHDLLGSSLEHVVLDRVQLVSDLVEDREAVVEEVVEHVVEQAAGAVREQVVAQILVVWAALEEPSTLGAARRSEWSRGSRARGRGRARPRSGAGRSCRRPGSGGRRTDSRRTRRSSAAGASRARPRCRAGAT